MTVKIYVYRNMTAANVVIMSGATPVRLNFTNGRIGNKYPCSATFRTTDPVIQAIIENSPLFNKKIFLHRKSEISNHDSKKLPDKEEVEVQALEETSQDTVEINDESIMEDEDNTNPVFDCFIDSSGAEVYCLISTLDEASMLLKSKGVPYNKRRSFVCIEDYCKENNIRMPMLIFPRRRKPLKS